MAFAGGQASQKPLRVSYGVVLALALLLLPVSG